MVTSRDAILGRIRSSLGTGTSDTLRADAVARRLKEAPRGLIPGARPIAPRRETGAVPDHGRQGLRPRHRRREPV